MRERLITTAIEKFGMQGLEGASTRDIAAAADTAMSSITYHFGGKEGLYRAAAEHIFAHLQSTILDSLPAPPTREATDNQRVEVICATLNRIGQFMLADESAAFALFISREQQSPSPLMLELMQSHMDNTFERLFKQIALLRPDLDDTDVRATAVFLFGMAVSVRHSRATLCLVMKVEVIDQALGRKLLARLDRMARVVLVEA